MKSSQRLVNAGFAELIKSAKLRRSRRSIDDILLDGELEHSEIERLLRNGSGTASPIRRCDCKELISSSGKRLPCPPWHLREYLRQRSALANEAARLTSETVTCNNANGETWTARFNATVEPLVRERGLYQSSSNGSNGSNGHREPCPMAAAMAAAMRRG